MILPSRWPLGAYLKVELLVASVALAVGSNNNRYWYAVDWMKPTASWPRLSVTRDVAPAR